MVRIGAIDALCGSVVLAPKPSGTDTARPRRLLAGSAFIGPIRNQIENVRRLRDDTLVEAYGDDGR